MQQAEKERVFLPELVTETIDTNQQSDSKFLASIQPQKIRLLHNKREFILTKREFETLSLLSSGMTMKQAAYKMGITARTIETHLHHTKNKANTPTSANLFKIFRDNLF